MWPIWFSKETLQRIIVDAPIIYFSTVSAIIVQYLIERTQQPNTVVNLDFWTPIVATLSISFIVVSFSVLGYYLIWRIVNSK